MDAGSEKIVAAPHYTDSPHPTGELSLVKTHSFCIRAPLVVMRGDFADILKPTGFWFSFILSLSNNLCKSIINYRIFSRITAVHSYSYLSINHTKVVINKAK